MVGKVETNAELEKATQDVVNSNIEIVKKILRTGKQGPVMHLVGVVMKNTQNKADPVIVKHLI